VTGDFNHETKIGIGIGNVDCDTLTQLNMNV